MWPCSFLRDGTRVYDTCNHTSVWDLAANEGPSGSGLWYSSSWNKADHDLHIDVTSLLRRSFLNDGCVCGILIPSAFKLLEKLSTSFSTSRYRRSTAGCGYVAASNSRLMQSRLYLDEEELQSLGGSCDASGGGAFAVAGAAATGGSTARL